MPQSPLQVEVEGSYNTIALGGVDAVSTTAPDGTHDSSCGCCGNSGCTCCQQHQTVEAVDYWTGEEKAMEGLEKEEQQIKGLEKEEQEIKEEITEGMHNGAPAKEVEAEEEKEEEIEKEIEKEKEEAEIEKEEEKEEETKEDITKKVKELEDKVAALEPGAPGAPGPPGSCECEKDDKEPEKECDCDKASLFHKDPAYICDNPACKRSPPLLPH